MNQEREYTYDVQVEMTHINEHNLLKPASYQLIFANVAERHLERLDLAVERIKEFHMGWVLVSLSLEIVRPLGNSTNLHAHTWHSQRKGPYYRREFEFFNEKEEIVFRGATYSVMLDLDKRTICRLRNLPFHVNAPVEEMLITASPQMKQEHDFAWVDERKVYNSYIDCFGHVNNCRYGEFAYDALDDQERERLCDLKRMDIYFHAELGYGDRFAVGKAWDGDTLYLRGENRQAGKKSFDVVMQFAPCT